MFPFYRLGLVLLVLCVTGLLTMLFSWNHLVPQSLKRLNRPLAWNPHHVSNFQCVGDEKHHGAHVGRGCVFENICFLNETREFIYLQPERYPLLFDEHHGPIYEFGAFVALTQFDIQTNVFGPRVVTLAPAPSLPWCSVHPLSALWLPWSTVDANLGHLLWEEMGSMYYLRRRLSPVLGPLDPDSSSDLLDVFSLLPGPDLPTYPLFRKILDAFLPALTSRSFQVLDHSCCFPQVLVGGVERMFYPLLSHNQGKEELLFGWRNQILRYYRIPEMSTVRPTRHHRYRIRVVEKTGSFLGPARRRIVNVAEVVRTLQEECQTCDVGSVQWDKQSFQEQLQLMNSIHLLITPCGGISMILPFLPIGAHAIIMDFFSEKDELMFEAGTSASMEAAFWNAWPHVHKLYYQVFSRAEIQIDPPWIPDENKSLTFQEAILKQEDQQGSRDYGNIVVDLKRIVRMARMARMGA